MRLVEVVYYVVVIEENIIDIDMVVVGVILFFLGVSWQVIDVDGFGEFLGDIGMQRETGRFWFGRFYWRSEQSSGWLVGFGRGIWLW